MSSLTTLALGINNLSSILPATASHDDVDVMLPRLRWISFSKNQLKGKIPSSFARCRDLHTLTFTHNQLSGNIPPEFGNLSELRGLYLGDNYLTGTIPTSFGNLTNLIELGLFDNRLHGGIPMELGNLLNLEALNLENNELTGSIPISLSNASSINILELTYNNLTGTVPAQLGSMSYLQGLHVGWNKLSGGLDFITSLSNCRALEDIGISGNELEGPLPDSIGNLSTHFLYFDAHQNHIKGRIPDELGNLSSLLSLNLYSNELIGTIPFVLTKLDRLQALYLNYNTLQGFIPTDIGHLGSLNELYLEGNPLTGSIPESMGNITGLQYLSLSTNNLSSNVPSSIWSLGGLLELNLSNNFIGGLLPSEVRNLKVLDTLDLSANQLTGSIPDALGDLQSLSYLDLSHNSLGGGIPQSFKGLLSINDLNLSNNNLSGSIPSSLANLRYLSTINLSFNRLEGQVPKSGAFSNLTVSSLAGNTALCGGAPQLGFPSCSTNSSVSYSSKTKMRLVKIILPTIASIIILVACFWLLITYHHKKRAKIPATTDVTSCLNNHRLISYHELVRATNDFDESNLLGRGAFGSVFRGQLDDGLLVAIKVLNLDTEGASKSFDIECQALGMARHRNLVKIISTCSNLDYKALILQFMPKGDLERWLYSGDHCLNLLQRISIMLDVATALEYLHHHFSQVVVHCDLKPSNVLLDEDMTAHVGDFGIAKLFSSDSTSVASASTAGTIGYVAPEYASTGRVSRKGDVYSFGILLLETLTRKKPTDAMFDGESSLRQWVHDSYPAAVLEIMDCSLLTDESNMGCTHLCLSSMMELGLQCSSDSPKERMPIKEVVLKLQKIKKEYLSKVTA